MQDPTFSKKSGPQAPLKRERQSESANKHVLAPVEIEWLVIGYGNDLRGDDGVGRRVVELVETWRIPGVSVLSTAQLTIDISEQLARARRALFVDAYPACEGDFCQLTRLRPGGSFESGTHVSSPSDLMFFARHLYGRSARCWMLTVPGVAFEFGENMSSTATEGAEEAVTILERMFRLQSSSEDPTNA